MQLALHSYLPLQWNLTTSRESGFENEAAIKLQPALP